LGGTTHVCEKEMGSFYTNVTLRTADRARVRMHLAELGMTAYVSRPEEHALVVFERSAEEQDTGVPGDLAAALSGRLGCAALAVTNHDDDLLLCALYEDGRAVDEYNSSPDYFAETEGGGERGGDAAAMARAFGVAERAPQIGAILSVGADEDAGIVSETDRHQRLVETLGLPRCAVGTGYTYLEAGEYPSGYGPGDFQSVDRA
jgi:hypothetical protein